MADRYGPGPRRRDDRGTIGFSEVEGRTFDANWRGHSTERDYSGISYGLSGGHRRDATVYPGGGGLEAGYMAYGRSADADARAYPPHDWRARGPYSGRGPRGYRRADERICDDVNDRLTAHGWIDATDIQCHVEDGEVTLEGFVGNRVAKREAEDLAEQVAGVRDVHNHLRIRRTGEADGVGRTSVLGLTDVRMRARRR